MKLTALLLAIACVHASAHTYSQTVSFSGRNVPLQAVLASIEKQTGLSFFFNYVLIKDTKPVTLEVTEVPLEVALDKVLKSQGLSYYEVGKTVFIVKQSPRSAMFNMAVVDFSTARQIDVRGRVTNLLGEPLVSATVAVKNGKKATVTDEKGGFELKSVALRSLLEISYLGYQSKEVEVEEGEIIVQLPLADNQLDQAQVIAYGQTTQRYSVANITSIKAAIVEKQPVQNPLLALEGRVPGLFITQSNGLPGSGVTVRIQGQNSISNGNDPLYVIDGVPYMSELLSTGVGSQLGTSGTSGVSGNPMNYINPLDIESIEILKDADATAIYGSRAANGAILITTKKGKAGKSVFSFNLQSGWGNNTRKLSLLSTQQYLQMRHEALINDGLNPNPSIITTPNDGNYDIDGAWDTTSYTDWQKVLLGSTAQYTTFNGSMSGGSATTQYLVGGTYHRETTVFPGNYNDAKGSIHFNLSTTNTSQKLRLQITCNYMFDDNQVPSTDFTSTALRTPPNAPHLYKADGTLNWQTLSTGTQTWANPLSVLYKPYQNKTYNLVANGVISYQILPGFEIRSNFGYTNLNSNETLRTLLSSYSPANQIANGPSGRYGNFTSNWLTSWIAEPQIEYKKVLGDGKLDILAGSTFTENISNGLNLFASGFTSDALTPDLRSAASVTVTSSVYSQYKYSAAFSRLNYVLKDKYIVDLTVRRDGSSRFGPEEQFHNFTSAAVGWIFSEEKIIKDNFPSLSFGKLRGSYGTTGSDQIGDYRFMNLYNSVSTGVAYQGVTGLAVNNLPNPYLQWEETRKLQVGIELGFWRNRILLIGDYVFNRSSNELVAFTLPTITGFPTISENLPAKVQNTAAEFTLTATNIKKRGFAWTSSITCTLPANKLVDYYGQTPTYLVIGKPLSIVRAYHSLGVNPTSGQYYFADFHGNATSTPNSLTDRTDILNVGAPSCYGGFENNFQLRQLHLDFLFQFVKITAPNYILGPIPAGYKLTNEPTYVLNRWQQSGDLTSTQRYNSNLSLFTQYSDEAASNLGYSDASYIRLKNVSLSYDVKERTLRRIHFQSWRIYIEGQNLFTITRFKGLDPESGNSSLPPLRIFVLGMQFEL